jgi:hypothetical protein
MNTTNFVKCNSFNEFIATYHDWNLQTFEGCRQAQYSCWPFKGTVILKISKSSQIADQLSQLGITKIWKDMIYVIESQFSTKKYAFAKIKISSLAFDEVDCIISTLIENKIVASLKISHTYCYHQRLFPKPTKLNGAVTHTGEHYESVNIAEFNDQLAVSTNSIRIALVDCGSYLHLNANVPVPNEFLNRINSEHKARGVFLLNNRFPKI